MLSLEQSVVTEVLQMQKSNSPFLGIRPDLSEVSSFMLGSGLSVAFHALPTARNSALLFHPSLVRKPQGFFFYYPQPIDMCQNSESAFDL